MSGPRKAAGLEHEAFVRLHRETAPPKSEPPAFTADNVVAALSNAIADLKQATIAQVRDSFDEVKAAARQPRMPTNGQIGRFSISADFIRDAATRGSPGFLNIFRDMVVVRAESDAWRKNIEYVALCADFEELPLEGAEPPLYSCVIHQTAHGITSVRWEKVKG